METPTREELEERIQELTAGLQIIKDIITNGIHILVNVDIESSEVGKNVRLYTEMGRAIGTGEKVMAKTEDSDLFGKGYATYKAIIDVRKLLSEGTNA